MNDFSAIDGFLVNSRFYAERMGTMLGIPPAKLSQVPLGLDLAGYPTSIDRSSNLSRNGGVRPPIIGYLARIAPEKGFHLLVDAFLELRRRGKVSSVRLHAAGWQGPQHSTYYEQQYSTCSTTSKVLLIFSS